MIKSILLSKYKLFIIKNYTKLLNTAKLTRNGIFGKFKILSVLHAHRELWPNDVALTNIMFWNTPKGGCSMQRVFQLKVHLCSEVLLAVFAKSLPIHPTAVRENLLHWRSSKILIYTLLVKHSSTFNKTPWLCADIQSHMFTLNLLFGLALKKLFLC